MSVESTYNRYKSIRNSLGERALNSLFPNDVELYMIALELVNSNEETEEYFVFPINPSSISEPNNPIQSIQKTAGGITILNTTTFSPTNIQLQGNFGRGFKILLGKEVVTFAAFNFSNKKQNNAIAPQEFDPNIKSGYGCLKILERVINKSNSLDSAGKPYALFFYNLALGNSYLVKALNFTPYTNEDSNRIWSYNLSLQSLIKIEDISNQSQKSLTQSLSINSAIQSSVNSTSSQITQTLSSTIL